jgi:hypothetical protein
MKMILTYFLYVKLSYSKKFEYYLFKKLKKKKKIAMADDTNVS